jgi:hypothetical protein
MTVNERLCVADLINAWDASVRAKDRERMIAVLRQVDMGELAASTVDAVLARPEFYGYFEGEEGPPRVKGG